MRYVFVLYVVLYKMILWAHISIAYFSQTQIMYILKYLPKSLRLWNCTMCASVGTTCVQLWSSILRAACHHHDDGMAGRITLCVCLSSQMICDISSLNQVVAQKTLIRFNFFLRIKLSEDGMTFLAQMQLFSLYLCVWLVGTYLSVIFYRNSAPASNIYFVGSCWRSCFCPKVSGNWALFCLPGYSVTFDFLSY